MSIILKPKYRNRKSQSPPPPSIPQTAKKHIRQMLEMVTVTLQQQSRIDEQLSVLKKTSYMDRLKFVHPVDNDKQNTLNSPDETNKKVRIRRLSHRMSPLAFYQDNQPSGICNTNEQLKILSYPLISRNTYRSPQTRQTTSKFEDYCQFSRQPLDTVGVTTDRTIQTQTITLNSEKLPEIRLTRPDQKRDRKEESCKVSKKRQAIFNFIGKMNNAIGQEFTDEHILKEVEPNQQGNAPSYFNCQLPPMTTKKDYQNKSKIFQNRAISCLENIQPDR